MRRSKGLSFYEKKKRISVHMVREVFGMVFGTFAAVLLAFVLVFSAGMRTNVIGVSMEPTLYNGQQILINRFGYKLTSPKKGDVIVFLPNGNQNAHYYIKRVVALPGEKVQIIDGKLYVDGIAEDDESYDKMEEAGIAENEIVLKNDEYFVLGDNRNISEDSRSGNIGPVNKDTIYGKAWFHMSIGDEGMGLIQ
ncbi:signal peptidase I [Kineothrix sp. MB12-C1]|uniref:signal peptidase I n=1 Tax=Kineothrix sp. MB12-C1 TaxID=3070215 RepID=UPI0027D34AC2|nr:signal peptidase I [Kineothrix sp. MB12-C1]WMC92663.1 signal peptidase I [Kineothrix sp. MB12-C1]